MYPQLVHYTMCEWSTIALVTIIKSAASECDDPDL